MVHSNNQQILLNILIYDGYLINIFKKYDDLNIKLLLILILTLTLNDLKNILSALEVL